MVNRIKIFVITLFFFSIVHNVFAFDKKGNSSFISELKTGVVAHDVGFFGRQKEGGLDSTFEFLFRKINYNLDHFERWIEQASRFNESISIINFLENNLDNI